MTILRLTYTFIVVFSLIASGTVFAQDARWAFQASFGLGTVIEDRGYPVVTFIPTSFLLFDINEGEVPDSLGGYSAVTTQDGVRLFMLSNKISTRTTRQGLGEHSSVFFNAAKRICEMAGCDEEDDDKTLTINAGEVFRRSEENGQIKLTGMRFGGQEISGVVSSDQLAEWNRKGIVTFADEPQPRLSVTREDGNYFNLKCAGRRDTQLITIDSSEFSGTDRAINKVLELARINDGADSSLDIRFNRPYGGENRAYKFRLYRVKEHEQNRDMQAVEKQYAAQITYQCEVDGAVDIMHRILSVNLSYRSAQGNLNTIPLKPESTPEGLRKWTGTPHYLYSVNNPKQYFDLMAELGEVFPNRAEAGYFLSEFNRSCSSSHRRSKHCTDHQYR